MTHNALASTRVGLRQASVSRTRRLTGLLGGLLCIAMLTIAGAASGESWSDQFRPVGVNGSVDALVAYNGSLIAGGSFTQAGGVSANHIALWDGTSWSALGAGLNGDVTSLAVFGTELVAAGFFTQAGGLPANHIARWDGVSWAPLGAGINNTVLSLAVFGSDLVAGGSFTQAGGLSANNVARWDGGGWSGMDSGTNGAVHALTVYGADLVVGGAFTQAGGLTANHLALGTGISVGPRRFGNEQWRICPCRIRQQPDCGRRLLLCRRSVCDLRCPMGRRLLVFHGWVHEQQGELTDGLRTAPRSWGAVHPDRWHNG
ncbi:MAG: hypothetical protein IPP62_17985 [bacterium]|nr:hypothetical protein [bacterium]